MVHPKILFGGMVSCDHQDTVTHVGAHDLRCHNTQLTGCCIQSDSPALREGKSGRETGERPRKVCLEKQVNKAKERA